MVVKKGTTPMLAKIIGFHFILLAAFITLCISLNQTDIEVKVTTDAHLTQTNPFFFPPAEAALDNIVKTVHVSDAFLDRGPRLMEMFGNQLSYVCNDYWEVTSFERQVFTFRNRKFRRYGIVDDPLTFKTEVISAVETCLETARTETENYYERAVESRLNTAKETMPRRFVTLYSSLVASQGLNIQSLIEELGNTKVLSVKHNNTTLTVPKVSLGLLGVTLSLVASLLVVVLRQRLDRPGPS